MPFLWVLWSEIGKSQKPKNQIGLKPKNQLFILKKVWFFAPLGTTISARSLKTFLFSRGPSHWKRLLLSPSLNCSEPAMFCFMAMSALVNFEEVNIKYSKLLLLHCTVFIILHPLEYHLQASNTYKNSM